MPIEWSRASSADRLASAAGDSDVEQLPGIAWRMLFTLVQLIRHPRRSFERVQEPVDHGTALRFLAAVRLPIWLGLLVALAIFSYYGGPTPTRIRPAHELLDPRLVEALSLWLLLLVPAGLPLLYFFNGIFSHVALSLTGGAPRSIGATLRATGYALAPALICVAILEVTLHTVGLGFVPVAAVVAAIWLLYFVLLGCALTGTHNIPAIRGFLVALVPAGFPILLLCARAYLVLEDLPGWAPPVGMKFFVP